MSTHPRQGTETDQTTVPPNSNIVNQCFIGVTYRNIGEGSLTRAYPSMSDSFQHREPTWSSLCTVCRQLKRLECPFRVSASSRQLDLSECLFLQALLLI